MIKVAPAKEAEDHLQEWSVPGEIVGAIGNKSEDNVWDRRAMGVGMEKDVDRNLERRERNEAALKHFADLAGQGVVSVRHNRLRGDAFVDVTIEGRRYVAEVGACGPIVAEKWPGGGWGGWCYIGVSSIAYVPRQSRGLEKAWFVCKYHNQPRIDLSVLSDSGRRALAMEFGIPVYGETRWTLVGESSGFYASPAFLALKVWAAAHPRKIRRMESNSYLGDWEGCAIGLSMERS